MEPIMPKSPARQVLLIATVLVGFAILSSCTYTIIERNTALNTVLEKLKESQIAKTKDTTSKVTLAPDLQKMTDQLSTLSKSILSSPDHQMHILLTKLNQDYTQDISTCLVEVFYQNQTFFVEDAKYRTISCTGPYITGMTPTNFVRPTSTKLVYEIDPGNIEAYDVELATDLGVVFNYKPTEHYVTAVNNDLSVWAMIDTVQTQTSSSISFWSKEGPVLKQTFPANESVWNIFYDHVRNGFLVISRSYEDAPEGVQNFTEQVSISFSYFSPEESKYTLLLKTDPSGARGTECNPETVVFEQDYIVINKEGNRGCLPVANKYLDASGNLVIERPTAEEN